MLYKGKPPPLPLILKRKRKQSTWLLFFLAFFVVDFFFTLFFGELLKTDQFIRLWRWQCDYIFGEFRLNGRHQRCQQLDYFDWMVFVCHGNPSDWREITDQFIVTSESIVVGADWLQCDNQNKQSNYMDFFHVSLISTKRVWIWREAFNMKSLDYASRITCAMQVLMCR